MSEVRTVEEIKNYILELTRESKDAKGSKISTVKGKIDVLNWVLGGEK